MDVIIMYIMIASGLHSTTYGHGELMCGDIGKPRSCSKGAVTASGEVFDPNLPTMAVFAPTRLRMHPVVVPVNIGGGICRFIRANDKGSPRFIRKRGFDLTPSAVRLLGGKDSKHWSGKVIVCSGLLKRNLTKYEVIKWNLSTK